MENEVKNDPLDEIELVSKSQLKRESHDIQKLGKRLTGLNPEQLSAIPLDEPVLEAIALAHKIQNKRSALKRHYQFLAKLLRARDTESIIAALSEIDQSSQAQIRRHHQAEHWRDEIIANGGTYEEARHAYLNKISISKETLEQFNLAHLKSQEENVEGDQPSEKQSEEQ